MQIPKLTVLTEAGAVQEVEAIPKADGWALWITYGRHGGEQREALERQRGGVRVFTTLEAVAHCITTAGLSEFRVRVRPP